MIRNRLTAVLLALIALLCLALPAAADDKGSDAPELEMTRYAYVYNVDFDTVMYEQNTDKPIYPASTVKMMTGILAIEYYRDAFDTVITVTDEMLDPVGGTKVGYKSGESLTVEQLLHGLLVANGNDAAYTLAFSIAGSVDGFVAMMNQKAAALSMNATAYTNPTGVDDTNAYTTVRDVARLATYAAHMDDFIRISSCERYIMPATNLSEERTLANKNYLVSRAYSSTYYLSYATGLNAGETVKGGQCCVALATKDGVTIVAVAMNVGSRTGNKTNFAFADAKAMLQWAYRSYGYERVLASSEIVCEIPVSLSSTVDHVSLLPAEDVYVFLPYSVNLETEVRREYSLFSESLTAPVAEGTQAGEMVLFYQDREVGRVPLIVKNAVGRSPLLLLWSWVKGIVLTVGGLIVALCVLFAMLTVVLANAYLRGRNARRRR